MDGCASRSTADAGGAAAAPLLPATGDDAATAARGGMSHSDCLFCESACVCVLSSFFGCSGGNDRVINISLVLPLFLPLALCVFMNQHIAMWNEPSHFVNGTGASALKFGALQSATLVAALDSAWSS